MIPEEFRKFILEKVSESEKMFVTKKKMNVDAKPEFIKLFKSSHMISSRSTAFITHKKNQMAPLITL